MEHTIHPLRLYCLSHKMRLGQLADLSGVSQATLSLILNDKRLCSAETAMRLSEATHGAVSVESLIRWGRAGNAPQGGEEAA